MTDEPIDFAAVKAEHHADSRGDCAMCNPGERRDGWRFNLERWPCLPYRLADEAERLAGELTKTQKAAQLLGEIVSRDGEWICQIAGIPMPADGDADYELAWDRARNLADKVARVEALTSPYAESVHDHGPLEGYPECPACWVADLHAALADQPEHPHGPDCCEVVP